jgi:hypothetical protein
MSRLSLVLLAAIASIFQISSSCKAEEDPYASMRGFVRVTSSNIAAKDCSLTQLADFEQYPPHLPLFREAWLNKEFSIDFYNQRRKQVFLFVVLKRAAEFVTEALYSGANPALNECSFRIDVKSFDKFGKARIQLAVSWSFNRHQAEKVVWDNFDPRNFHNIAIDYKTSSEMDEWISDEPSMMKTEGSKTDAKASSCEERFLRANAIFIRATTFCKKNYMDSRAGDYALAKFKQCGELGESVLMPKIKAAMEELDRVVKQKGNSFACQWVGMVEQSVLQSMPR